MPRILLFLCAVILTAAAAVGATRLLWPKRAAAPVPGLLHTNSSFEFVVNHPAIIVGAGGVRRFVIPVKNTTDATVHFGPPQCHCACSEPVLPKQQLGPGEEMAVELVVRVGERTGNQLFYCHWADDTGRPWTVGVRVGLYLPEQFDQGRLSLGAVEAGRPVTGLAVFRQHANCVEDLPPAPTFRSQDSLAQVTAGEPTIKQLGDGLVCRETPLTVTVTPLPRPGYSSTRVDPDVLRLSFVGGTSLLVEWTVNSPLTAYPSRVVFLEGGHRPLQRVVLKASNGGDFRVTRVKCSDPNIHATIQDQSPDSATCVMEVRADVGKLAESAVGEILIETTHPGAPRLSIPFAVVRAVSSEKPDSP